MFPIKPTLESQLAQSNDLAVIAEIKSKSPSLDKLPERNLTQQVKGL
ncbi:indole-3-glycerol phosphate synthase [Staphylococcus gallinarum]|uniref:Indole-3-glycerol phosphate synthase n=1 Tax=Staphylococcus gallinarum TaxID=1293 RepID=A0A380FGA4_STAGA|nr:indole-3-glycerol phosphate synthase [Staphylococcus gallinarum]